MAANTEISQVINFDQENQATILNSRDEENLQTLSETTSNNVNNENNNSTPIALPDPLELTQNLTITTTASTVVVLPNALELTQTLTTASTTQALIGNRNSSIYNRLPLSRRIILFIALALAMFFAALDQTIAIKSILKTASDIYPLSNSLWIVTSYIFTLIATLSIYTKFSEIFGYKYTFIFANSIFMVGSILCGASQNLIMIIIGRSISGIGGGGIICFTMINALDIVPEKFKKMYQVITSGIFVFATVFGPTIKGIFIEYASWRWAFFKDIPVSLFVIIVVIIFTEASTIQGSRREKLLRIDYIGTLLFSLSILANLIALDWAGNKYEWSSILVISFLVVGLLLFLSFIFVEFRLAKDPLIPFKLFKIRNALIIYICNFIIGMAIFSLILYIPTYFQVVSHISVSKSGMELWPLFIGLVLFSLIASLSTTLACHFRPFITIGFASIALAADLITSLNTSSGQGNRIGVLLLAGAGIGASMQTAILLAQQSVKHKYIPSVTCLAIAFQTIGSLFGIAIGEAIYNTSLNSNLKKFLNSTDISLETLQESIENIRTLKPNLEMEVMNLYITAIHNVFMFVTICAAAATIISLALKHVFPSHENNSEITLSHTQEMRQQ
ncbi:11576_t:CDS:1 [Ambispora leptoticha]|uniref:11576_t:CDS:1 n=1 Tax=Ambispora leptoticha TaxID=144679 RepID=A0A9N9AYX7_9GLOM|nr:11576_t:CDS:1 [Ambispora leptoticha]